MSTSRDKIPHIYQNIDGWFNFQKLYTKLAKSIPEGGRFVEIGTYKGCSFSYFLIEVLNLKKNVECIGVDAFPWPDVLPAFIENMRPFEGKYWYIHAESSKAAERIEDGTCDVVFIDANHTYEFVKRDIAAWLPKAKAGGIICGHDYNEPWGGVIQAVGEAFGDKVQHVKESNCWLVQL